MAWRLGQYGGGGGGTSVLSALPVCGSGFRELFERSSIQELDRAAPELDHASLAKFVEGQRGRFTVRTDHVGQLLVASADRPVSGGVGLAQQYSRKPRGHAFEGEILNDGFC